jgi:sulfur carrier protein
MNLMINGERVEVPETVGTIAALLKHFDLQEKVVIVEKNAEILEKTAHTESTVSQGDRIELVHFVGGG